MSRSATMVIMYLMKKFEIDWKLAFNIVKVRRKIIDPNEGFIEKLKEYNGKQYKIKRTITIPEDGHIEETEEFSGASSSSNKSSSSSSSSSEDLMERRHSFDA